MSFTRRKKFHEINGVIVIIGEKSNWHANCIYTSRTLITRLNLKRERGKKFAGGFKEDKLRIKADNMQYRINFTKI